MQFSFNLLRIKGLYMFRALLAHPQEALHKRHLVNCGRIMSVGCGTVAVILNKLNEKCITLVSLYRSPTMLLRYHPSCHVLQPSVSRKLASARIFHPFFSLYGLHHHESVDCWSFPLLLLLLLFSLALQPSASYGLPVHEVS
jgi:hypothetical protein